MSDEHHYELTSKWIRDKIVSISPKDKSEFEVATPLDFWPECPPGTLSPEDLFLASAVSCYGVSLTGIAKRFHAEFTGFEIEASGNLKQGEFGWEFEKISLSVRITVPTEKDKKKMKKAAERAHRYCLVSNSMKCPVHLSYDIAVV